MVSSEKMFVLTLWFSLGFCTGDIDPCENAQCSHLCTKVSGTPVCSCYRGFELKENKTKSCERVDRPVNESREVFLIHLGTMSEKFCNLTLQELRDELRKRNAKLTGRKKELIERLQAYDRNKNFSTTIVPEPEFNMIVPVISEYNDLHCGKEFIPLDQAKVDNYLLQFGTRMDDKAIELYNGTFLRYVRLCKTKHMMFIRSACRAEMKKSVSYIIDISFANDGHIVEAQCECAAGMGPNAQCKHVRTVLLACVKFQSNKEIKVEQTCTEKLQTFHHVKKFTGSPLKARNINMPGAGEISNADFDPRPPEFRNMSGYADFFRNCCLNMPGISKMPVFQLYEPANTYGIAHDHDYFELLHEDNYMRQIRVEQITTHEIEAIEKDTRGQALNPRWHSERRKRIQSSQFGRVCKATEKTDFVKLANSMVSSKSDIKSDAILHGRKYEKDAVYEYEKLKHCVVKPCGIFVSETVPFIGSSPDGVVNKDLIIEVKCPFTAKNKQITTKTVPYLELVNGELSLKKNHDYYYQVQGQLHCSGRKSCDFIVYTITDVKCIHIGRDEQFIGYMLEKLQNFYVEFFKPSLLDKCYYKPF